MSSGRGLMSLLAVGLCVGSVWADTWVRGDAEAAVEIFSDGPDRVWVAVDRDADGAPEELYGFVSREATLPHELLALLPIELPSANVLVSERRLQVEEVPSGQTWTLSIDPGDGVERAEVARRGRRVGVTLSNGAAFGRYELFGQAADELGRPARASFRDIRERLGSEFESFAVKSASPAATPQPPLPLCPNCASGGMGSSSCSSQCSSGMSGGASGFTVGGNGAVNLSASCSVSCGNGYFSCCNCSLSAVFTLGTPSSCQCIRAQCR